LYFKKQTIDIQIGKITIQITRQTRIKKQTIHDLENWYYFVQISNSNYNWMQEEIKPLEFSSTSFRFKK